MATHSPAEDLIKKKNQEYVGNCEYWSRRQRAFYSSVLAFLGVAWGLLGYLFPSQADVWSGAAMLELLFVIYLIIKYLGWCTKIASQKTTRTQRREAVDYNEEEPLEVEAEAAAVCRNPDPVMAVVWRFEGLIAIALVSFTFYVADISVPDYVSATAGARTPQVLNLLMDRAPSSPSKLPHLVVSSAFFCAGSLCTVGAGEAMPAIGLWGRIGSFLMVLFDILLLPVLLQYILCSRELGIAFGYLKTRTRVVE